MDNTWWRKAEDLDGDQRRLVAAPMDGNYLVLGPPGCGKTNILVLRGAYLHRGGNANFKVISFTRTLAEFIASGIARQGIFPADRVSTMARWSLETLRSTGAGFKYSSENLGHDEAREERLAALERLVEQRKLARNYYSSVLLDEVQDYWGREVRLLANLTPRLFAVGDSRQRIYDVNEGIDAARSAGCKEHILKYHYRLGRKICAAADLVLPDPDGVPLERHCQYNEKALPSSVQRHQLPDRQSQYKAMLERVKTQLRAYPDEWIGVIAPKRRIRDEIAEFLSDSEIAGKVKVQHEESNDRTFEVEYPVCVVVAKSSKGTEFRAVHLLAADEIPYFTRELAFTVITRAKTSLDVYHTGGLDGALESAVTERRVPNVEELFP
jgi:superfamily I DNA and RNA helicase